MTAKALPRARLISLGEGGAKAIIQGFDKTFVTEFSGRTASVIAALRRYWRGIQIEGVCSQCGCTDDDCSQCIEATGEPCAWANEKRTLCTRCTAALLTIGLTAEVSEAVGA